MKEWLIPTAEPEYVCAMEAVLDVYERPYDEENPVVCLDESPQQLVSEVRAGFTDAKGVQYQDFEYKREGVADLYMVCEPLRGQRAIFVKENHNRLNWAEVIRVIAEEMYPQAQKITIVQDNLSAHKPSALDEIMLAEQSFGGPMHGLGVQRQAFPTEKLVLHGGRDIPVENSIAIASRASRVTGVKLGGHRLAPEHAHGPRQAGIGA